MHGQLRAEDAVIRMLATNGEIDGGKANTVKLLSDRSAVDPIVYAAMSDVPGVFEKSRRLLNDPAFQRVLPLYRHFSLFGMSHNGQLN